MRPLSVNVAFVVDCTSSMEPWIDELRSTIGEIVDSIHDRHPSATLRMALVAYRDYGDSVEREVVDFTSPPHVQEALDEIHAFGGGDEADDVAGGLEAAVDLTWGLADVRTVIHIADAPAHGRRFHHASVSDRFLAGDPEGRCPVQCLRILADRGISYTFVRIVPETDMMMEVFLDVITQRGGQMSVLDLFFLEGGPGHGQVRSIPLRASPDGLSSAVIREVNAAVDHYTSLQVE
jgi:hypothetical protein